MIKIGKTLYGVASIVGSGVISGVSSAIGEAVINGNRLIQVQLQI